MGRIRGLTLLELLISLLLLAILTSVSLPGMQDLLEQRRSDAVMNTLVNAVNLGKTLAITSGNTVTLCRSTDGETCGGRWLDGALLFTDANGDRELNQGDSLSYYFNFPEAQGELRWRAFQNRQYLQFTSQGFTRYQNGNFTYCPANKKPELVRQLIINRTARMRFALDSNGDGISEDSSGKPVLCE